MQRSFRTAEPVQRDLSEFEEGETVILDKGYCNESIVTIQNLFGKYYARIQDLHGQQWNVMIFRLSKN